MKHARLSLGIILAGLWSVAIYAPTVVLASIPAVYTNDNYLTSTHDKPLWFYHDNTDGVFYGATETGKYFRQYPITNELGVRLMRFEIDEAYLYITDRGVIWAESDIAALSVYLSLREE